MNIPTGRPRGRPPGSPNKRRKAETSDAFTGDAHALLMQIYKDPNQPIELRLDAAKAAIRYEKPALAAVEVNATIKRDANDLTDAELEQLIVGSPEGQESLAARLTGGSKRRH